MVSKFYTTWRNMLNRCLNKNNPAYKDYGGRGIKVCKRWLKYENFEDDMYDEYGYWLELNYNKRNILCTLDRIDNSKEYSKKNCRWTTQKEQCNNRRYTPRGLITINKKTKQLDEWLKIYNITRSCYFSRTRKSRGWNKIKAIITPVKNTCININIVK